eukprot:COSAG04_NODE_20260_length_397_cov_1.013423_1_plen_109_part_10
MLAEGTVRKPATAASPAPDDDARPFAANSSIAMELHVARELHVAGWSAGSSTDGGGGCGPHGARLASTMPRPHRKPTGNSGVGSGSGSIWMSFFLISRYMSCLVTCHDL